jgi:hypothetical protein
MALRREELHERAFILFFIRRENGKKERKKERCRVILGVRKRDGGSEHAHATLEGWQGGIHRTAVQKISRVFA